MRWLITLCCTLLVNSLTAQTSYKFFQLFLDKGLSDARVTAIAQDRYGFMWFATPNGLNRYDGYSIKSFYYTSEKSGLPSNSIISLYSSRKGDLWIGTAAGVVQYDFVTESFLHFDSTDEASRDVNKFSVNDFEEDKDGNIYVACDKGVIRYLYNQKKWENLNTLSKLRGTLRRIRRLKFFSDELLVASTSGNIPLFLVNTKTHLLDSIAAFIDGKSPNMYGIEKLNEQEILCGTLSHGVLKMNIKTKLIAAVPGVLGKSDSIRYNTVYDILKDSHGRIWLASFYFRLAEFRSVENKISLFKEDPDNPYGFEGNSALCVFEDRQHNIWVGTSGKGVYHFNPDYNAVKFTAGNDHIPSALQRSSVLSITVSDSITLLIGTDKGPSFYNYKTGLHTNYRGIKVTGKNAPLEYTHAGLPDVNGKYIWMGTNRLGLARYEKQTGKFICFSRVSKPYPLDDDGITDLLQLPDGNIFLIGFGTPGIFDAKTFQYFSYRTDSLNPVFKLRNISSICFDKRKNIWLATNEGRLYEYDVLQKKLSDRSAALSFIGDLKTVYKISRQENDLFLATNAGIVILENQTAGKLFRVGSVNPGLTEVRGILPDGEQLWFCSNRLMGSMQIKTGKIVLLGEKEGFSNVQLFSRSLVHAANGNILVGSNKGYFEVNKSMLRANEVPPTPYLTSFRVYDTPLKTTEAFSGIERIRLSYDQNFFTFDISAFNYEETGDIQYAYLLNGFDKDWHYTGNQRTGSYTNVPGGRYTLRLKARNGSGNWNENGQQVEIYIAHHFAATWWFKLLVLAGILGLVYLLYRYRIDRIDKEARLRSDYEIKLNELENSALRTQMNPHFIFNSLNTINSFINRNEGIKANQYISKFSKLIRLILDHSREKKILLQDELDVLALYIQIERIRFENKFDYELHIGEGIDPGLLEIPPLIIQPFVENAILHGLLPLDSGGVLKISIDKSDELLLCVVEDNGVGRKVSAQQKQLSPGKNKSHGIEITMKRIELFNKEHHINTEVQVMDKLKEDGSSAGTLVKIPVAWEESF